MSYQVTLTSTAVRSIKNLSKDIQPLLTLKLEELALNPHPDEAVVLASPESLYLLRLGDYRIVYQVGDDNGAIAVVKVAHLKDY